MSFTCERSLGWGQDPQTNLFATLQPLVEKVSCCRSCASLTTVCRDLSFWFFELLLHTCVPGQDSLLSLVLHVLGMFHREMTDSRAQAPICRQQKWVRIGSLLLCGELGTPVAREGCRVCRAQPNLPTASLMSVVLTGQL